MTRVLPPTEAAITEAATLIRAGELVAFPTETVYGLGANAFDRAAVDRIFVAKGRPTTDPLIVHVSDRAMLHRVAATVSPLAEKLITAFWPGALTLILPRAEAIPANVSAGLPTVAVRMPAHPVASALIIAAGMPIAAPSANRFAHTSPTTAAHVYDDLSGRIALILDGGATPIGVESTILDLSGDRPRLLRPGGMSLEALCQIVPDIEIISRFVAPGSESMPAPGMLLRHYAPRAALYLFEGEDKLVRTAIKSESSRRISTGEQVGLLIADEDRAAVADSGAMIQAIGSLTDLESAARNLFAGLRALDESGVSVILARNWPPAGLGLAIRDRLLRAAEGKITHVAD